VSDMKVIESNATTTRERSSKRNGGILTLTRVVRLPRPHVIKLDTFSSNPALAIDAAARPPENVCDAGLVDAAGMVHPRRPRRRR
jgi:hypothetical protein